MAGTLFVVATPLGNLDDLSPRALETLRRVDRIACEDTRRTRRLLSRHGLRVPLLSVHRFNEAQRLGWLLRRLADGDTIALVSDGGTPGISDPGALLVREVLERGFEVRAVPGPSAVATLLSVSGLPADRYVFDGFLPHRGGERRRRLRELSGEVRTLVVFETPHRIHDALRDIAAIFGERRVVLGRELTKRHESVLHGSAGEIAARLDRPVRGEVTLAIAGAAAGERLPAADRDRILGAWREALRLHDGDSRAALREVSRRLGLGRSELYRRLAELGEAPGRGPRRRPSEGD